VDVALADLGKRADNAYQRVLEKEEAKRARGQEQRAGELKRLLFLLFQINMELSSDRITIDDMTFGVIGEVGRMSLFWKRTCFGCGQEFRQSIPSLADLGFFRATVPICPSCQHAEEVRLHMQQEKLPAVLTKEQEILAVLSVGLRELLALGETPQSRVFREQLLRQAREKEEVAPTPVSAPEAATTSASAPTE
jgi:hypothetical protein